MIYSDGGQTLTLTATSQNFTNGFFKFTGDGLSDESTYTDGAGANSDTFTYTIPASHFSTPKSIRVGVAEGDQNEVAFDTITISAVQPGADGDTGATGPAGADAYTVVLTNEAHALPTTSGGTVDYNGSGTEIIVYKGTTQLTGVTGGGTPTSGQFTATPTDTNITVGSETASSNKLVFADASSCTSDTAEISFAIKLESASTIITKLQTFNKTSDGAAGADAKTITTNANSLVFVKAVDGTLTPSSITITANGQNLTQAGAFSTTVGTLSSTSVSTSGGSTTVASGDFVDGMVITYTTHGDDGSLTDSVTLKELDEGSGNVTAILSNEAHILPAGNDGAVFITNGRMYNLNPERSVSLTDAEDLHITLIDYKDLFLPLI